MLKASAQNCTRKLSEILDIGNSLFKELSRSHRLGQIIVSRPALPNVPSGCRE
jgi:hypothetical protein